MKELLLGNEAVARGLYEAGCGVVSSYPGTPSTEITEAAAKYPEIYAEWAPNEKVAMEVAIGSAIGGKRSFCGMKHVGLNVAADPLFTASYAGVNAGMVMREAWEMTASSADRPLYQEMRKVGEDIRNGVSEAQAYYLFGIRTVVPEIRKFTSSVIQGLEKGNKELAYLLADMSSEMWETRKQDVVRQGELASGKLMIPMLIMFAGILVMVLVPVFSNLGL